MSKTKNSDKRNINVEYSFYDWCKDNNHDDWLELWDYELNDKSPKDISYRSAKKCWFNCINHNPYHYSELHYINHIVDRGITNLTCHQCNSFAQWGIDNIGEDFLEKYWDYDKNGDLDPFTITYSCHNKVWIKCQEVEYHGSYHISCSNFIRKNRCPYCSKNNGKIHIFDSLGYKYPEILDVWSDKNKKSPYEYSPGSKLKIWLKCKDGVHEDYQQTVGNAVRCNFRCTSCTRETKESNLQRLVSEYINKYYNYELLHEHNCTINMRNPKTDHKLFFDNEIKELKLLIEVHGSQHYLTKNLFVKNYARRYDMSVNEALEERQFLDQYKKEQAIAQGYHYLEIPYTSEQDESYKMLIDNKIKEILEIN